MNPYNLNVAFTPDQLEILYATGSNVIVAKPTGGSSPNVAWQVFTPMQANTLSWQEQYGIYASTAAVTNGATLTQLSSVPVGAYISQLYTLQPTSNISGPASGGTPNAFSLQNLYSTQPYMTVGLYQNATVNGTAIAGNAISAVPVLLQSTIAMTPYTTLYIWLQSQVVSNTVVSVVTSPMTQLTFGGGTSTISVSYNSSTGLFQPTTSGSSALSSSANALETSESNIKHIKPSL